MRGQSPSWSVLLACSDLVWIHDRSSACQLFPRLVKRIWWYGREFFDIRLKCWLVSLEYVDFWKLHSMTSAFLPCRFHTLATDVSRFATEETISPALHIRPLFSQLPCAMIKPLRSLLHLPLPHSQTVIGHSSFIIRYLKLAVVGLLLWYQMSQDVSARTGCKQC